MKRATLWIIALAISCAPAFGADHWIFWDGWYGFVPSANRTIQVGDRVIWRNPTGPNAFHVVSQPGFYAFDSGYVYGSSQYEFVFAVEPPYYPYYQLWDEVIYWQSTSCQIIINAAPTPTATPDPSIPATGPGGLGLLLAGFGVLLIRRRRRSLQ